MIETIKEFKVWCAHFCYSPQGKLAIDQMKKLKQGDNEYPYGNLRSNVLSACFIATKYLPAKGKLDSFGRIGGIQLPASTLRCKSKRKPQNVGRNSLILHLSTFFRYYTGDESTYKWVGIGLPNFGEDQSELVANFVVAVYPKENLTTKMVERFFKKSRKDGMRLAHWILQE